MNFTARQIAEMIHGTIIGNPDVSFSGFSKIEDTQPKTISFIGAPQYVKYLSETKAEAIIITRKLVPDCQCNTTLIVVEDAHQAFVELIRMYDKLTKNDLAGISPNAFIDNTAKIGNGCYIGDTTVIMKNAVIGDNCKIYPQVFLGANVTIGPGTTLMPGTKIYDNCHVGSNCLIHAGVVIGSDGFGFTQENGVNVKVPQLGNVIIGNDVEIGANSAIDKSTLGSTVINNGVKLDNLVHIAHNVEIGANTVIAAQSVVAGSTKIGHNCLIGGQVGISDHLTIGNNVRIVSQSGIIHNIGDNETLMGSPAFNHKSYLRSYACFRNLPKRLNELDDSAKNNK